MYTFDLTLFYYIHSFAGRSSLLDAVIVFLANDLVYLVVVGIVGAALWSWYRARKNRAWKYTLALLSGLLARFVVAAGIRHFYVRLRPFVALGVPHLVDDSAASFPSGHTIFMFALATVVFQFNKKLGWLLFVLGLLIGIARVAVGVHYPSDIVGGVVLGVLTGYLVHLVWNMKKQ